MTKQYDFTPAQDWSSYFQKLFDTTEIKSILEFGLGLGTEFLCDNAKKVTSVELSVSDLNKDWTEKTKEKLKDYTNWSLHYIEVPPEIVQANQNAIDNQYPLEDTSYLPVLKELIDPFLKRKKYDLIFVDPGIHNRGDIVNLCFGKANIIAAHDTDRSGRVIKNIYGYNIVDVPESYTEIHFDNPYMGTTFWIKNDFTDSEKVKECLK